MSDFKSKIPDLKELGDITSKLFNDIKKSVTEIFTGYKEKRAPSKAAPKKPAAKPAAAKKTASPKAAPKKEKTASEKTSKE